MFCHRGDHSTAFFAILSVFFEPRGTYAISSRIPSWLARTKSGKVLLAKRQAPGRGKAKGKGRGRVYLMPVGGFENVPGAKGDVGQQVSSLARNCSSEGS